MILFPGPVPPPRVRLERQPCPDLTLDPPAFRPQRPGPRGRPDPLGGFLIPASLNPHTALRGLRGPRVRHAGREGPGTHDRAQRQQAAESARGRRDRETRAGALGTRYFSARAPPSTQPRPSENERASRQGAVTGRKEEAGRPRRRACALRVPGAGAAREARAREGGASAGNGGASPGGPGGRGGWGMSVGVRPVPRGVLCAEPNSCVRWPRT